MNVSLANAHWNSLALSKRIQLCARLCHSLTIVARGAYGDGGDSPPDSQRLRDINEMQHRLTSAVHEMLTTGDCTYADQIVIPIFFNPYDDKGFEAELQSAFSQAAAS